jgi:hypothetical protein
MSDQLYPRSGTLRGLLTDMGDGAHEPRVVAHPPFDLLTDGGDGEYRRLRVDVGQTGFFAGREAYTFHEFSIATGASRVIKVVSPVNTIVQRFSIELDLAAIRLELVAGGTEGGVFDAPLPIFKSNTMTTASTYTPQITMVYGGSHTGGTVVDVLTAISGDKLQKSTAATATEDLPVGFAPGTYYIRIINTDGATASGIFRARWEERP